jgi:flagellin-specific chaperone FliS
MYQASYRNQEYRQNDVMNASPLHLVIMAYDLAINSCDKKDFTKATKAITVLRDALNFDYPEVSVGLFKLYQWCLDCLRKGDYAGAKTTLVELRNAWKITEQRLSSRPPNAYNTVASQAA